MTLIGQSIIIYRGYEYQAYLDLQTSGGGALISPDLVYRIAPDENSAAIITKTSGVGIDVTLISGRYLLTLQAADTALLTESHYYHELNDNYTGDLLMSGMVKILDTLEA